MGTFVLWNQSSKTLTASQSFNENPCEVISFKDVSNSFPVQVWPDYIIIMPGFAFLILNVAKSLTTDGCSCWSFCGRREGRGRDPNLIVTGWHRSAGCSQCIRRGAGSNLKMSRWQYILTMEHSSSTSSSCKCCSKQSPSSLPPGRGADMICKLLWDSSWSSQKRPLEICISTNNIQTLWKFALQI